MPVIFVLLMAPACTRLRHHISGGGGGAKTRPGTLTVTPPSGKVATPFSLTAGGFRPGEAMTFEIDLPNKSRFVGPSHTADPQGTVTSTYMPLSGDPPGLYQVMAVGNQGTRAQTSLTVTG